MHQAYKTSVRASRASAEQQSADTNIAGNSPHIYDAANVLKARTTSRFNPFQAGFSMIELLVVLVILGLLAGLVGQQFLGKVDTSKVKTAETQVKMLKMALQTYRLDNSRYPTQLKFLNSPPEQNATLWSGPYLSEELPLDPWAQDYVYQVDANAPQGFYLYSYGADNKKGGEGLNADVGYVPQS